MIYSLLAALQVPHSFSNLLEVVHEFHVFLSFDTAYLLRVHCDLVIIADHVGDIILLNSVILGIY